MRHEPIQWILFFFQAEDGIRDVAVTGVQTCALPISLLNTASGATWVSLHHGGGVGMGFSQHAGVVIVCDGSEAAAKRIGRVLWNDPASGVMRHADAGYDLARQTARDWQLDLPMQGN